MAWLTTYDDTNKILDESTERTETVTFLGSGIAVVSARTVTEEKYRYVAMAKDSAASAMTALLAATPSGTTRQVMIRRQGPANGYDVCVSDIVYGAWAEV
jgi:hypothetical protein